MKQLFTLPFITALLAVLFFQHARAAKVDTVLTRSAVMKKDIKAAVVTPDDYSEQTRYPVIYLLHGYGGKYSDWTRNVKSVPALADQLKLMIVCPDGNVGSWYFDSPVDESWRYETYVSKELVTYIDSHYATIKDRKGRGITGLSMGGHGALYLAFKHQDVFGVAGSMSGGVDFRPFPNNWQIAQRLGTYAEKPENWEKNTVINLVNLLTPNNLALIIDCGTEDFFYRVNVNLHEKLQYHNIPHDFITRPGAHNWAYWDNAINYQALYMSRYFNKTTTDKK